MFFMKHSVKARLCLIVLSSLWSFQINAGAESPLIDIRVKSTNNFHSQYFGTYCSQKAIETLKLVEYYGLYEHRTSVSNAELSSESIRLYNEAAKLGCKNSNFYGCSGQGCTYPGDLAAPDISEEEINSNFEKEKKAIEQAKQNAPKDVKQAADELADPNAPEKPNAEMQARIDKYLERKSQLKVSIEMLRFDLEHAQKNAPVEATEKCNNNEATRDPYTGKTKNQKLEDECNLSEPQKTIICLESNTKEIEEESKKFFGVDGKHLDCWVSSSQAERWCSALRNDKAIQAQKLMSIAATVMSKVNSASESCGITSNVSKIAQGGILLAQGICAAKKYSCDTSCASANKSLEKMKESAQAIQKCNLKLEALTIAGASALKEAQSFEKLLDEELNPQQGLIPKAVEQCKKHKLDIALLGVTALGFLSAHQDAVACKEQLTSGGSGKTTTGSSSSSMTTTEYCAVPQNASSITCKCTANPNSDGCLGSIGSQGVGLGHINSGGGASGFASFNNNGAGANGSQTSGLGGANELAKQAVSASGTANSVDTSGQGFGLSAPANAGTGSTPALRASSGETMGANANTNQTESDRKFGLFSSVASMFGGGKSSGATAEKTAARALAQEQAVKRKIASDQLRAEISSASGKSNFDKIKERYRSNFSSLEN